jgi:hypothetical protein
MTKKLTRNKRQKTLIDLGTENEPLVRNRLVHIIYKNPLAVRCIWCPVKNALTLLLFMVQLLQIKDGMAW